MAVAALRMAVVAVAAATIASVTRDGGVRCRRSCFEAAAKAHSGGPNSATG
jgi:hypothetical protein